MLELRGIVDMAQMVLGMGIGGSSEVERMGTGASERLGTGAGSSSG